MWHIPSIRVGDAKRQRTWFYRHADTHWFYRDLQDDNSILSQMISLFHNTF